MNSQLIDSLSTVVPRPVMVALHAEANHQIGELRTVTTLFMSLDTYDPIDNADPASLQPFFLIGQHVLSETGGYLRQFLIDDKMTKGVCWSSCGACRCTRFRTTLRGRCTRRTASNNGHMRLDINDRLASRREICFVGRLVPRNVWITWALTTKSTWRPVS